MAKNIFPLTQTGAEVQTSLNQVPVLYDLTVQRPSSNLLDDTTVKKGKYYPAGNGEPIAGGNWSYSEQYLPIDENTDFSIWYGTSSHPTERLPGNTAVFCYDGDKKPIGQLWRVPHHTLAKTRYIRVSFHDVGPQDHVAVCIGKTFTGWAYEPYAEIDPEKITYLRHPITEYLNSNVLFGKTLVTAGDSITEGTDIEMGEWGSEGRTPEGVRKTYGWQIAQRNSMNFVNAGVSGSTAADVPGRAGFVVDRYKNLPDHIDYLTLFFGWNDSACINSYHSETLGDIDSIDPNSFYGAHNIFLPELIKKYPYTKIVLMVPFVGDAALTKAIHDLGDKWGLAVFDMQDHNTAFYYSKNPDIKVNSEIVKLRHDKYQANGAHPNVKGHYEISTRLEGFLRSV